MGRPVLARATLVPPALSVGETCRLVHVTSTTSSALSADIADYDPLVESQSDASDIGIGIGSPIGDITWRAIGSRPYVDAVTHVDGPAPIGLASDP